MGDKDVERNVRTTSEEGVKTPGERYTQGAREKRVRTFGDKTESRNVKEKLLEKFKSREQKKKDFSKEKREGETIGRGTGEGEGAQD
ncbi:MAG: hypothetical protein CVT63_00230 [Candidatus Anoxymicrobium japonicum]|uniref:Uncharacterized protein n=1 Tax=Candidatus Anoxymicrobium japonicum TaxID=2013648 RepID=A0A2N3G8H4_9ACTN|nr:MAG: hypothetical protein CVT63_00230 [Candidatus Anoxymicrobium japonicum]